jgi:lysylphosphatidylglycerol synthetase-like protein (DUF2156 family)
MSDGEPTTSDAMREPTRTLNADGALLFFSALVIGANLSIARKVSDALSTTSLEEYRPVLVTAPITGSVCLGFALVWFARGATKRYRLMWLSALCVAAFGWPISCACSSLLTTPIGGVGHCDNASLAWAPRVSEGLPTPNP